MRPSSRDEFEIAIICALPLEADAVETLFDETYDKFSRVYGRQLGDKNAYITGRIGQHNIVLCYLPGMGKRSAAGVAANLQVSYTRIQLALVVGICGAIPFPSRNTEIILGDIIISDHVIEYDFGKQYPDGFRRKNDAKETLGQPNQQIRSLLAGLKGRRTRTELQERIYKHLEILEHSDRAWQYPGVMHDVLFDTAYRHKHYQHPRSSEDACFNCKFSDDPVCDEAIRADCTSLGCAGSLVQRSRLKAISVQPSVYIGTIASADTVMKSGEHRDKIAEKEGVIAFEMEGAAVWDSLPCIIIKGVCDYADSHKNALWHDYAAATAASGAKAFLEYWIPTANTKEAGLRAESSSGDVPSYPDFTTWLSQFAGPPAVSSTVPSATSTVLPNSTATSSSATVAKYGIEMLTQGRQKLSITLPAFAHNSDNLQMPVSEGDIEMVALISDLSKGSDTRSSKRHSVRVSLGSRTRVDELILFLMAKGYRHIEGFYSKDTNIGCGPMVEIDEPIPIWVVSSKSQYDISSGPLCINESEPFLNFYNALIACRPVHVSLPPTGSSSLATPAAEWISVECGGVRIRINLNRTLRVPDDGKVYKLPAKLGQFPLFNASQFQKSLPDIMKAKGGLFFPMYQREALWMSFSFIRRGPHCRRVAIRLLTGGVNAISGEDERQSSKDMSSMQDYVVVPGQRWIDGFRIDKKRVRQFVAMPLGLGYSVEKQITGEEYIGGIQFEILQERPQELQISRSGQSDVAEHPLDTSQRLEPSMTPRDIGLKSGDVFDLPSKLLDIVKYYYPMYRSNWKGLKGCHYSAAEGKRATLIGDFLPRTYSRTSDLHLVAIHDPISINVTSMTTAVECGGSEKSPSKVTEARILCSPFMPAADFYKLLIRARRYGRMASNVTVFLGDKILDPDVTTFISPLGGSRRKPNIFDLGITATTPVSVVYPWNPESNPLASSFGTPRLWDALLDPSEDSYGWAPPEHTASWQMAVAAGGLIEQEIFQDPKQPPYSHWDVASKRLFNIQILNSVAFESITGLQTPPTPISIDTYDKLGLPFFQYYEEEAMEEETTTIRDKVQSVATIDEGLAAAGTIRYAEFVDPASAATGCTSCLSFRQRCVANLCGLIVQPCNHTVCVICYEAKNANVKRYPTLYQNKCPVCSELVTATLEYSSPMGMPAAEKHLGFALQDVQLVSLSGPVMS